MTNFEKYLSKLGIKPGSREATEVAGRILDQQNANRERQAMKRHLQLVPESTPQERAAARRLAAFEDWWDAQWALTRARGAGTSTIDDVTAVRIAALSLKLAQQEQS